MPDVREKVHRRGKTKTLGFKRKSPRAGLIVSILLPARFRCHRHSPVHCIVRRDQRRTYRRLSAAVDWRGRLPCPGLRAFSDRAVDPHPRKHRKMTSPVNRSAGLRHGGVSTRSRFVPCQRPALPRASVNEQWSLNNEPWPMKPQIIPAACS